MNLHEYQAKQLFTRYGLPAPAGYACSTPREAEEAASKIGSGPWVVKCQVHAGGRGKAGGVKLVKSKDEIRAFAEQWLGKRLVTYQTDAQGQPVHQVLVEGATDIAKELYLGAWWIAVRAVWSLWPPPKVVSKLKKWHMKHRN